MSNKTTKKGDKEGKEGNKEYKKYVKNEHAILWKRQQTETKTNRQKTEKKR